MNRPTLLTLIITLVVVVSATKITSYNASTVANLTDATGCDPEGTTPPEIVVTAHHQLTVENIDLEDGSSLRKLQEPLHDSVSKQIETDDRVQRGETLQVEQPNSPEEFNKGTQHYTAKDGDAAGHTTQPAGDTEGNMKEMELPQASEAITSDLGSTEGPNQHDESPSSDLPEFPEPPQNSVSNSGKTADLVQQEAMQETGMPQVSTERIRETTGESEQQYSKAEENDALQTDASTEHLRQEVGLQDTSHAQENATSEVEADLTDSGLIQIGTTLSKTVIEGSGMETDSSDNVMTTQYPSSEPRKENSALATGCTPALCLDIVRANITATPTNAKVEAGDEVQFTCAQTTDFNWTGRWFRLRWLGIEHTGGSFQETPDGKGGRSRVLVGRASSAREMNFTCVPDVPIACCGDVGVTVALLAFEPPVYTTYMATVGGLVLLSAVLCLVIYVTHRKRYHLVASSDEADPEWQYVR